MELFFELLQVALVKRQALSYSPSADEWKKLYKECQKQAITAFVFPALDILAKTDQKAPVGLVYEWLALSEQIKAQNELMNREAARLTVLFEKDGHKTAILKGQANALLYPQPWSRQPGDIDIWVDGGKEKVLETVKHLGLLTEDIAKYSVDGETIMNYHHIHLKKIRME